jgi:hypothetical protein
MVDNKELVRNRKRAYDFVKHLFVHPIWVGADLTRDSDIAHTLDIELSDLTSLREGKANPSAKLVNGVKVFFVGITHAADIDHILVEPFRQR